MTVSTTLAASSPPPASLATCQPAFSNPAATSVQDVLVGVARQKREAVRVFGARGLDHLRAGPQRKALGCLGGELTFDRRTPNSDRRLLGDDLGRRGEALLQLLAADKRERHEGCEERHCDCSGQHARSPRRSPAAATRRLRYLCGGGVCESNTPRRLFTPHDGFEDRGAHQDPSASVGQLWRGRLRVSTTQRSAQEVFSAVRSHQAFTRRADASLCPHPTATRSNAWLRYGVGLHRTKACRPRCSWWAWSRVWLPLSGSLRRPTARRSAARPVTRWAPTTMRGRKARTRAISCVECHVDSGTVERVTHKAQAMKEVWVHIAGDPKFPNPNASPVPNERCVRCHEKVEVTGLDHAMHAKDRQCVDCHADAGHSVDPAALAQVGALSATTTRTAEPTGTAVAVVDQGSANVEGHPAVSCTRCHDHGQDRLQGLPHAQTRRRRVCEEDSRVHDMPRTWHAVRLRASQRRARLRILPRTARREARLHRRMHGVPHQGGGGMDVRPQRQGPVRELPRRTCQAPPGSVLHVPQARSQVDLQAPRILRPVHRLPHAARRSPRRSVRIVSPHRCLVGLQASVGALLHQLPQPALGTPLRLLHHVP